MAAPDKIQTTQITRLEYEFGIGIFLGNITGEGHGTGIYPKDYKIAEGRIYPKVYMDLGPEMASRESVPVRLRQWPDGKWTYREA